ncbi:lipocalin-like domain protein, partial [Vibrio cholerae HC-64A1]
GCCD